MRIEIICNVKATPVGPGAKRPHLKVGQFFELVSRDDLSYYVIFYQGRHYHVLKSCCCIEGEKKVKTFKEGNSNKRISKYKTPNDYSSKVERMFT